MLHYQLYQLNQRDISFQRSYFFRPSVPPFVCPSRHSVGPEDTAMLNHAACVIKDGQVKGVSKDIRVCIRI